MTIRIKVKGIPGVLKFLTAVFKNIDEGFKEELLSSARRIQARAKQYVPVRTGALRTSIDVKKISKYEYSVGSNLHYASFVEFGTTSMRAQPYKRPASLEEEARLVKKTNRLISSKIRIGV